MELSRAKAAEVLGEALAVARPRVKSMQLMALLSGQSEFGRAAEECVTAMEMGIAALREQAAPSSEQTDEDAGHASLFKILRDGLAHSQKKHPFDPNYTTLCVNVPDTQRDLVLKAFDRAIAVLQGE